MHSLGRTVAAGVTARCHLSGPFGRSSEKRWAPEVLTAMLAEVDDDTFGNFAITDEAMLCYFGRGELSGRAEGPL